MLLLLACCLPLILTGSVPTYDLSESLAQSRHGEDDSSGPNQVKLWSLMHQMLFLLKDQLARNNCLNKRTSKINRIIYVQTNNRINWSNLDGHIPIELIILKHNKIKGFSAILHASRYRRKAVSSVWIFHANSLHVLGIIIFGFFLPFFLHSTYGNTWER